MYSHYYGVPRIQSSAFELVHRLITGISDRVSWRGPRRKTAVRSSGAHSRSDPPTRPYLDGSPRMAHFRVSIGLPRHGGFPVTPEKLEATCSTCRDYDHGRRWDALLRHFCQPSRPPEVNSSSSHKRGSYIPQAAGIKLMYGVQSTCGLDACIVCWCRCSANSLNSLRCAAFRLDQGERTQEGILGTGRRSDP